MEREKKIITEKGSYEFGNNYELIFKDDKDNLLNHCNITCGNDCKIYCRSYCNITCGNDCKIYCGYENNIICGGDCKIHCGDDCNITCGSYCNIICGNYCYIKGGEETQLKLYGFLLKPISKNEEFIWWFTDLKFKLTNTFEDVDWKKKNPDMWNELYGFVHNELNSAILF